MIQSDEIWKDNAIRHIESISQWKIVSTVEWDTPRYRFLPTAKLEGDVERPTISRWCAGHCRDSSKT